MKNFFAGKRRILLIKGVANLVVLSIMAVVLLSSPLSLLAKPLVVVTVEQGFKAFCDVFYDGTNQKKDRATCKNMNESFAKVLPTAARSLWPDQSLEVLATKNKLGTLNTQSKFQQAWLKQIKDKDQKALIKGDKNFMPTLFKFKSSDITPKADPKDDIEERFEEFCVFYYNDEPEDEQDEDVPACEAMSSSFANVIPEDAQDKWPDESLKVLADDDELDDIKNQEDFEAALLEEIGDDKEQKALIEQDDDFIPTLFEFESGDLDD